MLFEPPVVSVVIISTSHQRLLMNLPSIVSALREFSAELILVCQGYQINALQFDGVSIVKVIHSRGLLGSSNARNCGANYATGEFICFLDDDIRPHLDFFRLMIQFMNQNPSYLGVLGSINVFENQNSSLFKKFYRPAKTRLGSYELWRLANGNSGFFRRTGLRFDPRLGVGAFFGAFEDADYLLQLSQLGPLGYLPNAILYHPDMNESETRDTKRMVNYARGLGGCFAKNPSASALIFLLSSITNNIISFFRFKSYPSTQARTAHLNAAVEKFIGVYAWKNSDHKITAVIPKESLVIKKLTINSKAVNFD